ncbi:MAG: NAD-dependent epimerase/dehydratase family protein [Planctomycetota bacterium]|jgi:nucleoside-diphosphate-sugar epimerase
MTSPEPQHVLVTGAAGLVGQAVARELLDAGFRVRALVRRRPPPAGTEPWPGDLLDTESLVRALRGQHAVVHCAALLSGSQVELERVNLHGTQLLAQLARQAEVGNFVHISTSAVYRPGPLTDAKEFAPLKATDPYAVTKLAAEAAVTDAFGDLVTTLRLPSVYADRPCPFLSGLLHAVRSCQLPDTNVDDPPCELVHAADVAAAVCCALAAPPGNRTLNVTGPDRATFRGLVELVAEVLGITPRWKKALAPGEAPKPGHAPAAEFPDFLYQAATIPRTLSSDAARKQLGYQPEIGWRDGLVEALGTPATIAS